MYKSTVGSASATGSIGGSAPDSADKMSEDTDDGVSSTGVSDDGDTSLVGFGETASSTVSGPTSKSGLAGAGVGGSVVMKQRRQQSDKSGSPMEGVDGHSAGLVGCQSTFESTPRTKATGNINTSMEGQE